MMACFRPQPRGELGVHRGRRDRTLALKGLQIADLPSFAGIWRQEAYDCTKFATDPILHADQGSNFKAD